ncbi:ABC transporter ATP-binding protein/permease [Corynebacterium caspium]|uniref:ABC transporter ATP-binding protein/permease n=1 Tax=Corynebacterium caspium TaxID=234828 RepID=UPI000A0304DC|nr:ABC transporter transmembrane domain-containing protein [Corynebacterium caspium]
MNRKSTRGPLDPRLLKLSEPTRRWILMLGLLTALSTIATVVTGLLVGLVTAGLIENPQDLFPTYSKYFIFLGASIILKAASTWVQQRYAARASAGIIVDLRAKTLKHLAQRDPRTVDAALWRTRLGAGIEGLTPYLTGYLPALAATVIAIPAMLLVVWNLDIPSLLIALITLPLIPFFMWLVGTLTAGKTEKRLADLAVLNNQLLDLIAGLTTLKIFNRHRDTALEVRRLSNQHSSSTLSVLRLAFLSSFVLEFLATLSVALMAVGIGFRLMNGSMTLAAGLTVLIIAPEIYQPLREVGSRFHDAQDGLAASDAILATLSTPLAAKDSQSCAPVLENPNTTASAELRPGLLADFAKFTAHTRDGARPHALSGQAQPGKLTALIGPNGAGKSTALLGILGLATENISGSISVTQLDAAGQRVILKAEKLWEKTIYVAQRPLLYRQTIGSTAALSQGQKQRLAIAQALEKIPAQPETKFLVVLDEPTAHLDAHNAEIMINQLKKIAANGHTVLVATHDPLLIAAADAHIEVNQ